MEPPEKPAPRARAALARPPLLRAWALQEEKGAGSWSARSSPSPSACGTAHPPRRLAVASCHVKGWPCGQSLALCRRSISAASGLGEWREGGAHCQSFRPPGHPPPIPGSARPSECSGALTSAQLPGECAVGRLPGGAGCPCARLSWSQGRREPGTSAQCQQPPGTAPAPRCVPAALFDLHTD